MINGMHTMIFAKDAERARAFLRDVLKLDNVDAGDGWLIFALPPAELGVHPIEDDQKPYHQLYLMCDDLNATMGELKSRGVIFTSPVQEEDWGLATAFDIPGGGEITLYQPRHPSPHHPA